MNKKCNIDTGAWKKGHLETVAGSVQKCTSIGQVLTSQGLNTSKCPNLVDMSDC